VYRKCFGLTYWFHLHGQGLFFYPEDGGAVIFWSLNVSIHGGLLGETNMGEGKDGILTNSIRKMTSKKQLT
jgi:hypothetical protein